MSDDTERALRDALRSHAADAPAPVALARQARTRVARRRGAAAATAALTVVLGVTALDGTGPVTPAGPEPASPDVAAPAPDALPDGWRWESYGGVEIAVPGEWESTNGTQVIEQWCLDEGRTYNGFVGRPGSTTLVGCPEEPGPVLGVVGPYVSFDGPTDDPDRPAEVDGDVATLVLDGVQVRVQAPQRLRERILSTVRSVDVDAAGCSTTHPISEDAALRPERSSVDVTTLTGVKSISACRYALDGEGGPNGPPYRLLSSLRLTGDAAEQVVAAIALGEPGGGPDRPDSCSAEYDGDEVLVLRVESDAGTSQVHVRYSGCRGNGFDDGVRTYALTSDAIRPLLSGSNAVSGSLLAPVGRLVWGP